MARRTVRSTNRNPLATDPEHEQRIRERAYHLWEADGKPHGHDVEYWERARELIGMEESAGSGLLPNPQTVPNSPPEAGVHDELGASPGGVADPGEVKKTPAAKRPARARAKPRKPA